MKRVPAYAAASPHQPLAPTTIERREPGPRDVAIEILFCGVCHSDLHSARGEWEDISFPLVPGHEIIGRVTAVGREVTRFRVGENVGVGVMVGSCRKCRSCLDAREQYCEGDIVFTYNSDDPQLPGRKTYGGYSKHIVVDEHFVLRLAPDCNLAATAPLLCAGITMYSPLRAFGAAPGKRVGIVGVGGLGHTGVKLAHALGAETIVLTSSRGKLGEAKALGAAGAILWTDEAQLEANAKSFDLILDTVAAPHDLNALLGLLRRDGTLCLVGIPPEDNPPIDAVALISKRRRITGSMIGGVAETQEMLDLCAANGIVADVEMIPIQQIEAAYARMLKSDVRYRFVIDMASLA
jgi:alcohol dehydrogenase (NADP+)